VVANWLPAPEGEDQSVRPVSTQRRPSRSAVLPEWNRQTGAGIWA